MVLFEPNLDSHLRFVFVGGCIHLKHVTGLVLCEFFAFCFGWIIVRPFVSQHLKITREIMAKLKESIVLLLCICFCS